jgi:methylated-DNA-[protein]-cysteine S-methyltransferase
MPEPAPQLSLHSPIGDLTVSTEARAQLDAYFDAALTSFDLPLAPPGTDFQGRVWRALTEIPWGETLSYGALARRLASAPRPVGVACGRNPIPIIIPCHRVIAADGGLGGYSGDGGVDTKRALLRLETAQSLLPLEGTG